jgi:hypothetical protein
MCRSIVSLRDVPQATPLHVEAAARQFVRKISGTKSKAPSKANQEAFDQAVAEIAESTARLLSAWVVQGRRASFPDGELSKESDGPGSRPRVEMLNA